ncbi:hypothetical protein AEM42_01455 [Betaproteobacteria bacterium UKL13-2]|jgi:hypothetical protein|nr:hypothetical protein AEM42_01455 [Betaproteobacteria bacterium UKL13-2]HCG53555.1 hypothetical protein [Betaproteobacteria bacterium]
MAFSRLIALVLLSAATAASAQSTLFRCVDEKGVTHYGETMPAACAKKDVTELSKQGRTLRKLDAPLTPEQQKAKVEADAKQRENDKKVAQQKQKDLALLGTYGAEREIDLIRDKDVLQLDQRKRFLDARIADVEARLEKVTNQMEFYIAGRRKPAKEKDAKEAKTTEPQVPAQLQADFDRVTNDRTNLQQEIARLEVDRRAVVARYETEKDRFRRLKRGMRVGTVLDEQGNVLIEAPIPKR